MFVHELQTIEEEYWKRKTDIPLIPLSHTSHTEMAIFEPLESYHHTCHALTTPSNACILMLNEETLS